MRLDGYLKHRDDYSQTIAPKIKVKVKLLADHLLRKTAVYLILDRDWGDVDEEEPQWTLIADLDDQVPFSEDAIPKLIEYWALGDRRPLHENEVADICLPFLLEAAKREDEIFDRRRAHLFANALTSAAPDLESNRSAL